MAQTQPLVVDLDGTLIKTDLLIESLLILLRQEPICLLRLPFWAARGMAALKHEVASRVSINIAELPWRADFLEYLRQQQSEGRSLVLATGADVKFAWQVADYLGLFVEVLASDGAVNLTGNAKRDALVEHFGEKGFDYAGDERPASPRERALLRSARCAINPATASFREQAAAAIHALRLSHWIKNLLVLVPLIAARRFTDLHLLGQAALAFLAFGCIASSGYVLNDLFDLEADRHHPRKRFRAVASGDFPPARALLLTPVLLIVGVLAGTSIGPLFLLVLLAYFLMSVAYTLRIKQLAILDVLFLAGLYSIRIMAGSAAVGIWSSYWLLGFSTFLFFSLALVKRYGELMVMRLVDGGNAHARAYELSDAELLASMGVASGYLSVTVLALYIASEKAEVLYAQREWLWAICPLLLYWVSHVWITAHRGRMQDDPVVFATTDRTSRIVMALMLAAIVLAMLGGAAA